MSRTSKNSINLNLIFHIQALTIGNGEADDTIIKSGLEKFETFIKNNLLENSNKLKSRPKLFDLLYFLFNLLT